MSSVKLSTPGQLSDNRMRDRTFVALLQAAQELILEVGYDAATVREITRRADYGRSTFYLHFRDKEDLVWTLLQIHMQGMQRQIAEAVQTLASPQREWQSWRIIFAEIDRQRHIYRQMDGEMSRRLRQFQKDRLIITFENELREGFYSLLMDVPPAVGARFVVGALLEILDHWLVHPDQGSAAEMADLMFQLVYRQPPDPAWSSSDQSA